MQLDKGTLAVLGVKTGTLAGVLLAFLLSGTYVKVTLEVDTRDTVAIEAPVEQPAQLAPPTLRFD